jgi:hypothetical protein
MLGWYASSHKQENYQLYFLAAALLIGWTYTIHFTHGIRTMHVFNVVLKRIIYEDVIRFAILYGFIVVGFSCAMHVLFFNFEAQLNEQPSVLDTIYQVIKISVGIGDVLDSDLDFNDTNYQTRSGWAGLKVLYIVFILIGNVILLNILIAMMSHRYEDIVSQETITWRYDYVSYIMKLPPFVRKVIERLGDGKKYQLAFNAVLLKRIVIVVAGAHISTVGLRTCILLIQILILTFNLHYYRPVSLIPCLPLAK